jgi:glycosyltransferase involved in cell wall biosynthesis
MKIALIAPSAIPARTANSIQVMKMAQALTGNGHLVRVYAPGSPSEMGWEAMAVHYGLRYAFEVQWVPAAARGRRYDYAFRVVHGARNWDADLVFTRLPQAGAYASQLGTPTIFEIHDFPYKGMGARLLRLFLRGRGARRLVVITHALAADLAAKFGTPDVPPFTVIAPDGVDIARYQGLPNPVKARKALNLPPGFTAVYTGHLYPGRGAELILEMAARIPEVNFLLVGGEPGDVNRVRKEAHAAGLENLMLTGFVPNAELPQYQAAGELLLMPYQERVAASSGGDIARYLSPMKMFEYLACGRAILSSDLPVLQEVLTPQNACILPADNPDAWASTIRSIKNEPRTMRSLAVGALNTAREHTWEARAEKVLEGIE